MKQDLALKVLGQIMDWDDDQATAQYEWLSLMSRLKFDGYQDFLAGARFIESLAYWIQQFDSSDRKTAYAFVRDVLVYVGPAEMLRLVELFFPDTVQRRIVQAAAAECGVPAYRVWANPDAAAAYDRLLRRTLFIGLSEGARLDLFRRANAGTVNNEQVLLATYADEEKWNDLLKELRKDLKDETATFGTVYLIDDFAGSGLTFIRRDVDTSEWKGKLKKFRASVEDRLTTHFDPAVNILVHHYLATSDAKANLEQRQDAALAELGSERWFESVKFTFGTVLKADFPVNRSAIPEARAFLPLAERYYDSSAESKHTDVGGSGVQLGFSECALPLILEHNTPNNSVGLLWAETEGKPDESGIPTTHLMRPLFRRRQRHS